MSVLEHVNRPEDLKSLSLEQLEQLAAEIRTLLIERVQITGGHLASNLGAIEPTIALHYVFHSPQDKIIFDVSHQCYTHKILTGRKLAYTDPDHYHDVSGFTTPAESEHDLFKIGHTATSISLACGLAKARDVRGTKENVIAFIGDGSLSGGEAFEGLDNAAALSSNIIIVVNDNEMSIAEDHGGLYRNLKLLRQTRGTAENNYFKTFGFDYCYLEDGNDLSQLIPLFEKIKDTSRPTVVHLHTLKGKGFAPALADKEAWHGIKPRGTVKTPNMETLTVDYLIQKAKEDPKLVVITAGTPSSHSWVPEKRRQLGDQFVDVGICEEHAVAFASGLAKGQVHPVYQVTSSFLQRAYDQLNQDLAMNNNPAVILVHFGKIVGGECTHNGMFDIPLVSNIPNLVCLAPVDCEEYFAMLDYAIAQNDHPIVIRVPDEVRRSGRPCHIDETDLFRSRITECGDTVALLGLGNFHSLAVETAELLKQQGIHPTVVDPVNYSRLDTDTLEQLKKDHQLVVTLEDGSLDGGYGQKVAAYYGPSAMKVCCYGAAKAYRDQMSREAVRQQDHLTAGQIAEDILHELGENHV